MEFCPNCGTRLTPLKKKEGRKVALLLSCLRCGYEKRASRPTTEMLMEAYKRAMPALSISETTEYKTRVETLEAQVQNLLLNGQRKEAEIQKLKRDLTTTALLEARINKLEELLKESVKTD